VCGRFTLTYRDHDELAAELGVPPEQIPAGAYRPRFNIAPTDPHWIVRMRHEQRQALAARWGLVNSWAKDRKGAARQINARAEGLERAPAFRDALQSRRCVVPADGFFEWVGSKESRRPIWFHRPDGGLFLFAGLYESWRPSAEEWERTFTIVTTTPNAVVLPVHDRMPVILPPEAIDPWLDPAEENLERLLALLRPAREDLLVATPVSTLVNSVKNDEPACLSPAAF
jgi:putative SOS response-associated peptidase YedK